MKMPARSLPERGFVGVSPRALNVVLAGLLVAALGLGGSWSWRAVQRVDTAASNQTLTWAHVDAIELELESGLRSVIELRARGAEPSEVTESAASTIAEVRQITEALTDNTGGESASNDTLERLWREMADGVDSKGVIDQTRRAPFLNELWTWKFRLTNDAQTALEEAVDERSGAVTTTAVTTLVLAIAVFAAAAVSGRPSASRSTDRTG